MTVGSITENNAGTRQFIKKLCMDYPALELADVYKALYQSSFGCEHLLSDPSAAADYIKSEARQIESTRDILKDTFVEPLDGDYCRVYLDCLKTGLTAETFARLFVMSAERVAGAENVLENKLHVFAMMAESGELRFSTGEVISYINDKKQSGYPPCHHSEGYRMEYRPAYRLLKKEFAAYLRVFAEIDKLLAMHSNDEGTVLIAIDGGSGSGKSTLSELIGKVYNCNIFHIDDFFLRPEQRTPERYAEPGGNFDRERFLCEVLEPIKQGKPVMYRRFDCSTFEIMPPVPISSGKLCVIEGTYSMHCELSPYYNLSVFLKVDKETQRERIIRRNGDYAHMFFEKWIPLEQKYFDAMMPEKRCNIVIENNDIE